MRDVVIVETDRTSFSLAKGPEHLSVATAPTTAKDANEN